MRQVSRGVLEEVDIHPFVEAAQVQGAAPVVEKLNRTVERVDLDPMGPSTSDAAQINSFASRHREAAR